LVHLPSLGIWLVRRLYLAYAWLDAGWHKLNDPAWMVDGTEFSVSGNEHSPPTTASLSSPTTRTALVSSSWSIAVRSPGSRESLAQASYLSAWVFSSVRWLASLPSSAP
jgi:hypothetical protein